VAAPDERDGFGPDPRTAQVQERLVGDAVRARLFSKQEAAPKAGRFTLVERIGSGAMGTVWAAYDSDLDRRVALKFLHEVGGAHDRVLREARSMAGVNHPNVVHVYEIGDWDEQIFIAMEYVPGPTLREWSNDSPGDWAPRLSKLLQAARGLAAAHDGGIVHGDFKPDNVLVGLDDRVRVVDFGLSSIQAPSPVDSDGDESRTSRGGTPAYMAPEQWSGEGASPSSDQFAFCVTAWEVLFGERPKTGDDHEAEAPTPTDARVPEWLVRTLQRGLSADPGARWSSMDALVVELSEDRGSSRRVAGVAAVGLVLAVAGGAWLSASVDRCEAFASELSDGWGGQRDDVLRHIEELGDEFARSTAERAGPLLDDYAAAWDAARKDACAATDEPKIEQRRLGCLERRRDAFDALVETLAESTPATLVGTLPAVHALPAVQWCADQRYLLTNVVLDTDSEVAEDVVDVRRQLARADARLAALDYPGAYELATAALARSRELEYAPLVVEALDRTANASFFMQGSSWVPDSGQHASARELADEAYVRSHEASLEEVVFNHRVRARILDAGHERDRAATELHKASEVARDALGDDHPLVSSVQTDLGLVLYHAGHSDAAVRVLEPALERNLRTLGPEAYETARTYNQLGLALGGPSGGLGRYEDAKVQLEEAWRIWRASLGADHPNTGRVRATLGRMAFERGDFDAALRYYDGLEGVVQRAVGAQHPLVALPAYQFGLVHAAIGDDETAIRHWKTVLSLPPHPLCASALLALTFAAQRNGDAELAKQAVTRLDAIAENFAGTKPLAEIAALVGSTDAGARSRLEALQEQLAKFEEPDLVRMLEAHLSERASER